MTTYNLSAVTDKELCEVFNPDNENLLNSLKLTAKLWKHNNKTYKIIKYQKDFLTTDRISTAGLFRSVIVRDNRVVGFAPPKSIPSDDFISKYTACQDKCIAEKYVEGTMINLFYDEDWEISTKSSVGGKILFFRVGGVNTTFRSMFLEACNHIGLDFELLDKTLCYSFVLQHPENRIVTPITECSLYLVKLYNISGYTVTELDARQHVAERLSATKVKTAEQYNFSSFQELKEKYASMNTPYDEVGVVITAPTGERTKFRNPVYEDVRSLRGNQPKLEYHYLSLRKTGKIAEYLKYYPEYKIEFQTFRDKLHRFTSAIHTNYIKCYIRKEKPLKEFPREFRGTMYNLHQYYLNELRTQSKHIDRQAVIDYVNNLHQAQQMFLLNYNFRKMNVENDANAADVEIKMSGLTVGDNENEDDCEMEVD